jgi:hypothetical protein
MKEDAGSQLVRAFPSNLVCHKSFNSGVFEELGLNLAECAGISDRIPDEGPGL